MKGGYQVTDTKPADGTKKSNGKTSFTKDGNPEESWTTNFKKDGSTIKEISHSDFKNAKFDEDHEMEGGYLLTDTKRADGTKKSNGKTSFTKDGNPEESWTTNFKKDGSTVKEISHSDFKNAKFDEDHEIEGGKMLKQTKQDEGTK